MTTRIGNPLPFFLDKRGLPMDGGRLYIGEAGEDPETNPLAVYIGAGLTTEATQPIYVIGGSPVQDGNPANFYVEEQSYSIRLRDRDGAEIFYEAVVEGSSGGGTPTDGAPGAPALTAMLSNDAHIVPADALGVVTSYAGASGQFQVYEGPTNVSAYFTINTAPSGNPQGLTVSYLGRTYTITDGLDAGETSATLTIRATGTADYLGVTLDKTFTLTKAQAGAPGVDGDDGTPGTSAIVGDLTNEDVTLPASADGTVLSYTAATGVFKVFSGTTDVSSSFALSTQSNPQSLTIGYVGSTYTVSGGFDLGEESASVTIRATGSGSYSEVIIDKVLTLSKSKTGTAGTDGADAKLLTLVSDRQTIAYDGSGAPTPSAQTTTFTVSKQNTSATVSWSITDANGGARTPASTYLSSDTGDTVTMSEEQFALARNGTAGVIVTATLTDGVTLSDKISIVRVQSGADGAAGPAAVALHVTREAMAFFTYADGSVASFANAEGLATVTRGDQDVTASVAFFASATGCTGSINTATNTPVSGQPKGYYRVTAMSADEATLVISAVYNGVTYSKTVTFTKAKAGYDIVDVLPATNLFEGRTVYLTTDGKLYRYKSGAWTAAVAATDITGQLTNSQIADIAAAKLTGQITSTQITDSAISTPKLAAGAVETAKLAASAVVAEKIAAGAVTTAKIEAGAITANELAANAVTANKIDAGAVTAAKVATSNLITLSAQIADGIIETAKITDLAVTTLKIGPNAVTVPVTANMVGTRTGDGTLQDVLSMSLTLTQAGTVFALFTAKQAYSSTFKAWDCYIYFNGSPVGHAGGAGGITDAIAVSASSSLAAGTHTIAVKWQGQDGTISLIGGTAFSQGAMK